MSKAYARRQALSELRHVRLFRNVIAPLRKRGLVALLKTMMPLDEDFPEIADPVPPPESVL